MSLHLTQAQAHYPGPVHFLQIFLSYISVTENRSLLFQFHFIFILFKAEENLLILGINRISVLVEHGILGPARLLAFALSSYNI